MATAQEILEVAQVSYPSWVRGGDWVDLSPPVRVIDGSQKEVGVFMLDPVAGKAILVGGTEVNSITDFVVSARQGRASGAEITEDIMNSLEKLLNIVSDERMASPSNGNNLIQTPSAVAARTLLDDLYMRRVKGLKFT